MRGQRKNQFTVQILEYNKKNQDRRRFSSDQKTSELDKLNRSPTEQFTVLEPQSTTSGEFRKVQKRW